LCPGIPGLFTDAGKAREHLDAGARQVVITAPAKNEDVLA